MKDAMVIIYQTQPKSSDSVLLLILCACLFFSIGIIAILSFRLRRNKEKIPKGVFSQNYGDDFINRLQSGRARIDRNSKGIYTKDEYVRHCQDCVGSLIGLKIEYGHAFDIIYNQGLGFLQTESQYRNSPDFLDLLLQTNPEPFLADSE